MNLKLVPRYFIRGCLVSAPLAATLYVVWITLGAIDRLVPLPIPGLGLIVTLSLITLVGFLTSNVVGRSVIELTEHALQRLPLVKLLYTSVKDLVSAFVGDKRRFNEPVLVTLVPGADTRVLGFVTRHGMASLSLPHHVAVYLPQSYNFAGNLVLVPRDQIEPIDMPTSDVMTFIVSGGISGFGVGQSILPEGPKN
jgi:uncharacterized membrane protein